MSDETTIKDENAEDTREERSVRRQQDKDKVSTNDAKSLKPEMLETTMPPLQIKNWYHTWDNYMVASGWRQPLYTIGIPPNLHIR